MVQIYDNKTGKHLGEISEEELQFIIDQLEEEWEEDREYYINWPTIDLFEIKGATPHLLTLLRSGMGERDEMEIRWTR